MNKHEMMTITTKNKIKEVFWELFKVTPIEKLTVAHITQGAGIHRATFYRHYNSIYEVLDEIENSIYGNLGRLDVNKYKDRNDLILFGFELYSIFSSDKEYLHYLIIEGRDHVFSKKYKDRIRNLLASFSSENESITDQKKAEIMDITYYLMIEFMLRCIDKSIFSIYEIIDIVDGVMIEGINATLLKNYEIVLTNFS